MSGQRKKKGGRVTPKGGHSDRRLDPEERAALEGIFEGILTSVPGDLSDALPLVVEIWASGIWASWSNAELVGADPVELFGGGLITYAARRATPGASMVLRALGAVAPPPYGARARREAERLAAAGTTEPPWAPSVGTGRPTTAWLSYDPVDDDGVSVMVEFDGPREPSTISVFVDHNLGGMAVDAFVAPSGIDELLADMREADDEDPPEVRQISLGEARSRCSEALKVTDMTFDSPSEDVDHLRVLIEARLGMLPAGKRVPPPSGLSEEAREDLLVQFLDSDELVGLWGVSGVDNHDDDIEHLAHQILAFSLDYVLGTPLRFSPTMVELFCLDWAPRKVALDGDAFTLLPDVLAAWIRFVGRRRGLPETAMAMAIETAYDCAPEMIDMSLDPNVWGPGKTISLAIQQRGIDPMDQAAMEGFIAEVNINGGLDVLAESLVESVALRR